MLGRSLGDARGPRDVRNLAGGAVRRPSEQQGVVGTAAHVARSTTKYSPSCGPTAKVERPMALYEIVDEPQPSPWSHLSCNPFWVFLATMLGGSGWAGADSH